MRLTSDQRIFVHGYKLFEDYKLWRGVSNSLNNAVEIVSPTKITIWKMFKGSSLNLNKIAQAAGKQNVHGKTLIFYTKSLSRIKKISQKEWLGH